MWKFEIHQVGNEYHKELWILAERLEEFNLSAIAPSLKLSMNISENSYGITSGCSSMRSRNELMCMVLRYAYDHVEFITEAGG